MASAWNTGKLAWRVCMSTAVATIPFDSGYRTRLEILTPFEERDKESVGGPDLALLRAAEYLRLAFNQFDSIGMPENQAYLRKLAKGSFVPNLEELVRQIHYARADEEMFLSLHEEWFTPGDDDFEVVPSKEELTLIEASIA